MKCSLRAGSERAATISARTRHIYEELWIVDVDKPGIHFCRGRTDIGYSEVEFVEDPGRREIPPLEGVSIDLAGLLGED
jgi:hypothetical protein